MKMENVKTNIKQKMLIFHPVMATYRIDQFNLLHTLYDLEVVFLFDKMWNFNYDQEKIIAQCNFKTSYLLCGPTHNGRLFRFGMYRKIRQVKPDIIISYEYSFTTQFLILLKCLGLVRQKLGSTIDDSITICHNVQSKSRYLARNFSMKYLDFIAVMSDQVGRFYKDTFALTDKQVIVSPILQLETRLRKNYKKIESLGQHYVSTYQLSGKKVILFVGRFIPEKALSGFIENISSVLHESEDAVFVLVGEGKEYEEITSVIRENNLEQKVLLPGKFQTEELYGWYACASGFALPSLFEPFGAVVNEALIFGLPVLCSKYAGAVTLLNSGNGVIFDPADSKDSLEQFKRFVNFLNPVRSVSLDEKPSLMNDYFQKIENEWRKLNYE